MHERLNAINKAAVDLRLDGEMVSVKVMLIPEGNVFLLEMEFFKKHGVTMK